MPRIALKLAATIALATCSCASNPRVAQIDSPPTSHHAAAPSVRSQSPDFGDVDDSGSSSGQVGQASVGRARLGGARTGRVTPTAATFTPAEPRTMDSSPVASQASGHFHRSAIRQDGTVFYTAEPRGAVQFGCDEGAPCAPGAPCGPMPPVPGMGPGYQPARVALPYGGPPMSYPKLYPDEWLCDGGDRNNPVTYDDYNRLGLDSEDTIAEYVDSDGTFRMKPSTRVCVYAPRFGAMRTASGPQSDTKIDRLASAHETTYGAGLRNRDVVEFHEQRQGPDRLLVRSRLSGLDADSIGRGAHQTTIAASHTKLVNTFEDLQFFRTGQFIKGEEPWLAKGVQAAVVWTRAENPVIAAKADTVVEVTSKFRPAEIVGTEDRRKKGQLRIVKLADKKTAVPGDVITFTIRYDNLGDLPLTQVRIIDNLTPRLEYVEDSGTSDRAGQITVDDNHEGSSILTIELDDPLKGRTGGVITFQAKVR